MINRTDIKSHSYPGNLPSPPCLFPPVWIWCNQEAQTWQFAQTFFVCSVQWVLQFCTTGWSYLIFHPLQSILELEKERIQLLRNNLNQYIQHISVFGQTLTMVSSKDLSMSGVHNKSWPETCLQQTYSVVLGIAVPCTDTLCHQQDRCRQRYPGSNRRNCYFIHRK